MRTIGVIQPNYLPWRGYFDFIHEVDVFVFLDDVQYTVRDWRNRNRIRLPGGGLQWLTVPILGGRNQLIRDVRIDNSQPWRRKHLGSIERSYGQAPHFSNFFPGLSAILDAGHEMLADLDVELTVGLCGMLGMERNMVRASTIGASGTKDDRLLGIVNSVGGERYLSGPSAREYLRAGDTAKAKRQLVPVAYNPHGGRAADTAREMIRLVDARDTASAEGLVRDED